GDIGIEEWKASHDPDEENQEKRMSQFYWATPYQPPDVETTPLDAQAIAARSPLALERGVVPKDAEALTMGVDVQKHLLYWIVVAWRPGAAGHVVDYGVEEVHAEMLGVEKGILIALRGLRDRALEGWPAEGEGNANPWVPDQAWIDSGYQADVVYTFCKEAGKKTWRPVKGYGSARDYAQRYKPPRQLT